MGLMELWWSPLNDLHGFMEQSILKGPIRQALPFGLTAKITAGTSEEPSEPGAVPLGSNYLLTTASLQVPFKKFIRTPEMSLKSLTSSWETHEVTHDYKSISFISSLKLVNIHTAHNKDQQGRVEKSIPLISLHRGTCTALFMPGAR